MTSKNTENHGFEIPQDGYETTDPSYADLLEGSFDEVDARLEMRGPLSERPSAPPGGTKFIVDDPGSDHDGKRFIYRTSAGSWEHRPGNFSAISTGELYGAEPSINYANPQWLAQSDSIAFLTHFESLDGFGTTTSGSGSLDLSEFRVQLATGSTAGSVARLRGTFGTGTGRNTWDKDRTFDVDVFIPDTGSGDEFYAVTGTVSDADKTTPHFGFHQDGSDLLGTVGNGTAQNTTVLQSNIDGDFSLEARLIAGERVDFYESGVFEGSISTGMPTGGVDADHQVTLFAKNGSANNRTIDCDTVRVVQEP